MTDFISKAVSSEAEHALCDRRFFTLEEEALNAFEAALTAPLKDNETVQNLLASKSPWE